MIRDMEAVAVIEWSDTIDTYFFDGAVEESIEESIEEHLTEVIRDDGLKVEEIDVDADVEFQEEP